MEEQTNPSETNSIVKDPIAQDTTPVPEVEGESVNVKFNDLMSHFASTEEEEFEVQGYQFAYIPASAGLEYEWAEKAVKPDGTIDQALITKFKLGNVTKAPYTREIIKHIAKVDKDWAECSVDEKYLLFKQMRGAFLDLVVLELNRIDRGDPAVKNP